MPTTHTYCPQCDRSPEVEPIADDPDGFVCKTCGSVIRTDDDWYDGLWEEPTPDDIDDANTCPACGGSGGGPESWRCPLCGGSGCRATIRRHPSDD